MLKAANKSKTNLGVLKIEGKHRSSHLFHQAIRKMITKNAENAILTVLYNSDKASLIISGKPDHTFRRISGVEDRD